MSKGEFLKQLKTYLQGKISHDQVEDYIRYYDQYIDEQKAAGQTESQAVDGLGDPMMIGKNIVDAAGRQKNNRYTQNTDSSESRQGNKGVHVPSKLKIYGIIALVILIVLIVLVAVTKIIAFFFPIILVCVALALITRKRR